MWISNWNQIWQMLLIGAIFYFTLVVLLRIAGKRSLAKMNMFDFIVTVALGSTLANIALAGTPLIDGILAISMLLGFQYVISWLSSRNEAFDRFVKPPPRLLFYRGNYLKSAMHNERVSERELDEAIRSKGFTSKEDIFAVVLETTGEFSVVGSNDTGGSFSAFDLVRADQVATEFRDEGA